MSSITSITSMPSPVGELTIGATDEGIRFVRWNDDGHTTSNAPEMSTTPDGSAKTS